MRTLLKYLILPPAGLILMAALGALLQRRHPRLGAGLLAAGLGALWIISIPVASDALLRLAEGHGALDLSRAASAQAIVILGGGGQRAYAPEYGGPAADSLSLERLSYGAFVARRTGLPILVTGAPDETPAMGATLRRNFDVEPRWVEDRSRDTFDNAENSARLLRAAGVRRIVLVTHATHMRRSVREFAAVGLDVVPAPAGMYAPRETGLAGWVPNPQAMQRSYAAIYEIVGEAVRETLEITGLRRHVQRLSD